MKDSLVVDEYCLVCLSPKGLLGVVGFMKALLFMARVVVIIIVRRMATMSVLVVGCLGVERNAGLESEEKFCTGADVLFTLC